MRLAGGGGGARLYRGQRQGGQRTGGDGDSDGMMGSGGESDSSEEIHYGPGFVSRYEDILSSSEGISVSNVVTNYLLVTCFDDSDSSDNLCLRAQR